MVSSHAAVAIAATVVLLGACDQTAQHSQDKVSLGTPEGSIGSPTTISPGISTDPSLPAATLVPSADSSAPLQSKANPQGPMSKQEESMAMPKPGQANDHSDPELHPSK